MESKTEPKTLYHEALLNLTNQDLYRMEGWPSIEFDSQGT
jgi:hypothetical protein